MAPIWSQQPFKAFYILFSILKLPPVLILIIIRYSIKSLRPVPGWTLKQSVTNEAIGIYLQFITATRITMLAKVQSAHQKEKERYAIAEPAGASLYSGISTPENIKPAPVGGLWYPEPISGGATGQLAEEKVVLHIPGGAFVLAFGDHDMGQTISKVMSKYMKATRVFLPQYRVASSPDTRYPAAIQDCLTAYNYVLGLGVDPKNVILSGDSAGGNLVIAVLRYLQTTSKLPLPGGVAAWSPWVHVTRDAAGDYDRSSNADFDMLNRDLLQWGSDAYLPEEAKLSPETTAYISPLHHAFPITTPLYLHAGMAEALHDSVCSFAKEMAEMNGELVRMHSTPLMVHDILLAAEGFGMEPELGLAVTDACALFEQNR
ncbi:Alpha/Beta hydrolase protein [Xylariales sp. PMI_506]|nr:Alpha/Beta hydrolase protein [Xylariales sp. PMI_506]